MSDMNFDVFLSFRGLDTRTGFADFLYNSLVAASVRVFRDNEELTVGKPINSELYRAIRSCKTAIPIISRQYAESKWCLGELAKIIDCHRKHGMSVFPIFYKVDVLDVCNRRGKFGEAFRQLETKCGPEEVQKWKDALKSVTNIKGWISQTIANGHEGELVKVVVAKVSSELRTTWIEWLSKFPMVMANFHVRAAYDHFTDKRRSEVFLAFRCCDTGNGLAAYLYVSLLNAGIKVFSFDDPSLIGREFAQEIHYAINHCKISIPILSKNFASSTLCLDELAQMVECKQKRGQRIMPIFYKVNPRDVRHVSGCFKKKMLRHRERSNYNRWEQAFKEVGSFKGWESESIANGHEGKLVKQIVKDVVDLLKNPNHLIAPLATTQFLNR
ncbi:hypothetical protein ACJRO7_000003 [Eucalyptus globulus]|uniref:ADP-ribosyl cyclase/cyclic ADP-ribose hydrolase n=1 Tax=Eucalyptus globulus TaxID=34317 RepID=A0ABD3LRU5_EUCGL